MLEAQKVYEATGCSPAASFQPPTATAQHVNRQPVYELRQYLMHPGYGSVPKLLEAFAEG